MPVNGRIGPGGPFIPAPRNPPDGPPPITFDDDASDAWWSGTQMNFAAVPAALAAAALSTSVAIAGGFNKPADEVAPWLPGQISSMPVTTQRTRVEPTLKIWEFTEDLPVQITPLIPDDDGRGVLLSPPADPARAAFQPWGFADDPLPIAPVAFIPDDTANGSLGAVGLPIPLEPASGIFWATDEEVLPSATIEESQPWDFLPPISSRPLGALWNDAGDLPTQAQPPTLDESIWQAYQPGAIELPRALTFVHVDELALIELDESTWSAYVPAADPARSLPAVHVDEVPIAYQLDEQAWSPAVLPTFAPIAPLFSADSDYVQPPVLTIVDEAEWQVYVPPLQAPGALYLPDPEAVPTTLRAVLDEDYWQWFTPVAPAVATLHLPDPEALPTTLRAVLDEDYWQWFMPPVVPATATLWVVDDVVVPQPTPFGLDQDYSWVGVTPAAFVLPAVFMSDELLPGLLVTPVYGWGARSTIGGVARDPWQRIGSETAQDPFQRIGSDSANAVTGKIGSEDA